MSPRQRSFLKWPGNKYHCINHILPQLQPGQRLIEVFSGSATLFFNTEYPSYLLAEINQDVIALFTYLKNDGFKFISLCQKYFTDENNSAEHYYKLRQHFNQLPYSEERAAIFLYLNRFGFNGLCRYNLRGIYNVPFGRYIRPYFPLKELTYFFHKSQQAEFFHGDFRETFLKAKKGDILYCDPPYAPIQQDSNFSAYSGKRFLESAHVELAKLAENTAKKGIPVIISNHDTSFTRHQYRNADHIESFLVKRSINRKASERGFVKELIAIYR